MISLVSSKSEVCAKKFIEVDVNKMLMLLSYFYVYQTGFFGYEFFLIYQMFRFFLLGKAWTKTKGELLKESECSNRSVYLTSLQGA